MDGTQNQDNIDKKQGMIRAGRRLILIRKFFKLLIWVFILAVIIYSGYKLFKKGPTTPPGTFFEAQSRDHITEGATHSEYNSNPPTGGWHYAQPAQTGIYDVELPDEQLIHNLEHSHVRISYRPDLLDKDSIEKLVDLTKKYGPKMIMTPRAKNDSAVAINAWQYLQKFDKVDDVSLEQMNDFIKYHRGKSGPENPLDFGFSDFRGGKAIPTLTPMIK